MSDTTIPRNSGGQFQKGKPPGPGRPKGSRNRLGEAFISDLERDWLVHGPEVIERVAANDPSTYLRVVASILPKELNVTVSVLDTMTRRRPDDAATGLEGAQAAGTGQGHRWANRS